MSQVVNTLDTLHFDTFFPFLLEKKTEGMRIYNPSLLSIKREKEKRGTLVEYSSKNSDSHATD